MFTIKNIKKDGRHEIWEARPGVSFTPHSIVHGTVFPPTVHFTTPEGVVCSLDTGKVFVVNQQGATIARYPLDDMATAGEAPQAPQALDDAGAQA